MASISRNLQRIKDDLRAFLPEPMIIAACREAGHRWRKRLLDPVTTLHLFILQVLCCNTAMTHLRHLAKAPVKAAAYCKARMRLPLAALQELLRSSSAAMRARQRTGTLWCGLRTFLLDGTSTITPDVPELAEAFGRPTGQKKGCGWPVPKILALLDAFSGMVVEVMGFPLFTHEQSQAWRLHPLLGVGDLLLADRGLCSFAHLAMLAARGVAGVFRVHQRQIINFRPHRKTRRQAGKKGGRGRPTSRFIKRLGKHDQVVEWIKPSQKPRWMTMEQYDALPAKLLVRELKYRIPCKGQRTRCVTIGTTLLDGERYSKDQIAELYDLRWTAETHFAELKTTLKMRMLKSKTEAGVRKELAVYCLVYNLVHAIMLEAARRQGITDVGRVSFIDAVRWLLSAEPGEELAKLVINPHRPDRHEPRVTKTRHGSYPVMTKPRAVLKKALKSRAKNAK